MSDDKRLAFPELPEAVESALADMLGAQFHLGLATGKHGPKAIHSRMPVVLKAAAAVQSTVDAVRAALAAPQPPAAMPVPAGMALVPVDVTAVMVKAANRVCRDNERCKVRWEPSKCKDCIQETAGDLRAALAAAQPVPATGAQPWQKPGPVTAGHPLQCLIVLESLRQSDGDWWVKGNHFFPGDKPLTWMPDTPENRALLAGAPTAPTGSAG